MKIQHFSQFNLSFFPFCAVSWLVSGIVCYVVNAECMWSPDCSTGGWSCSSFSIRWPSQRNTTSNLRDSQTGKVRVSHTLNALHAFHPVFNTWKFSLFSFLLVRVNKTQPNTGVVCVIFLRRQRVCYITFEAKEWKFLYIQSFQTHAWTRGRCTYTLIFCMKLLNAH